MLDVECDLRGTLRNFGLKVGKVSTRGYEARNRIGRQRVVAPESGFVFSGRQVARNRNGAVGRLQSQVRKLRLGSGSSCHPKTS